MYLDHLRGLDVLDTRVIAALHALQSRDDRGGRLLLSDIMRATESTDARPGTLLDLSPLYVSEVDGVATRLVLRADASGAWRVVDLLRVGAPDRPALPLIVSSDRPAYRVLRDEQDVDLVRSVAA